MSENVKIAVKNQGETGTEDLSEISFSITLDREDSFRIKEMLKDASEEKGKELTETLIRFITHRENESKDAIKCSELEEAAAFFLNEFDIPPHTKGYRYLRDAIVLVAQSPLLIESITKRLYPAIADSYGTTSARVERVVRHAIESGCTRGDTQAYYYYFPNKIIGDKLKPTNGEFIAVISEAVKKRVSEKQIVFADM